MGEGFVHLMADSEAEVCVFWSGCPGLMQLGDVSILVCDQEQEAHLDGG